MNKRIVLSVLFCAIFVQSSLLSAIEQISVERVAQCKERLESRIRLTGVLRIAAAAGVLCLGAYLLKSSLTESVVSQVNCLTPQAISTMLAQQEKRLCILEGSVPKQGAVSSDGNTISLLERGNRLISWGASCITSAFWTGTNLLGLVTLNLITGEMLPYIRSAVSTLLVYPGSALRFYAIHARIPEILNEYTHYAKVLTQEHRYDTPEIEYASLYFLHEYTEIIYRIEHLLAYILTIGERNQDIQQDSIHLVEHLTFKTNQLANSLYACGMGNCPQNIVETIEEFKTELNSTIRLCEKRL